MSLRVAPVVMIAALALGGCVNAEDLATNEDSTPSSSTPSETAVPSTPSASPPTQTTPSETAPPEPTLAPRPEVGNCYQVGPASFQRQKDGGFPLTCSKRHTAETYQVFQVSPTPTPDQVNAVWRKCYDRFDDYVGASATVSTLGVALIMPSVAQATAGAGWIRCDVIERSNFNGKGGRERVGTARNVLAGSVPDALRGCSKRWPKVEQKVSFSSCASRHQAELIPISIRIGGPSAPFPGSAESESRSQTFCEDNVLTFVPEALRYYYYYPTRGSWPAGTRDTVCWALDTEGDGLPPI